MDTSPSEHLKALIATHIATVDWVTEIGIMPDDPDQVVMITDTVGLDPNPKYLLDFPSAQIMVRGKISDYLATRTEGNIIKDILLGIDSQDIGGDRLVALNMRGDLGFIGRDESMRPLFSMNFDMIFEPNTSANTNRIAL